MSFLRELAGLDMPQFKGRGRSRTRNSLRVNFLKKDVESPKQDEIESNCIIGTADGNRQFCSSCSLAGSFGNAAWGSVWYQNATEEISS